VWTQRQLATELGIDHTHVMRIENGFAGASAKLLGKYEAQFGIATGTLLDARTSIAEGRDLPIFLNPHLEQAAKNHERIHNLTIDAAIGSAGHCFNWHLSWTSSGAGVAPRDETRIRMLAQPSLVSECQSSIGTLDIDAAPDLNYFNIVVHFDEPFEPSASVKVTIDAIAEAPAQKLLVIPSVGQIVENASISIAWPHEWETGCESNGEEGACLNLFRTEQTYQGGTPIDIGPTRGELMQQMRPWWDPDLVEYRGGKLPFRFSDKTEGDVFGAQWLVAPFDGDDD